MFTPRIVATSVLNELNQPDNIELYERLKDRVSALRAKFIRQAIERNEVNDLLVQYYDIDVEKIKDDDGCLYVQTKCNVQSSISIKSSAPFIYVGTKTNKPYSYVKLYELPLFRIPKFRTGVPVYVYINNKIRVYFNDDIETLRIGHIFNTVNDASEFCSNSHCSDDDLLPIPDYMVHDIITALLNEFNILNINTNKDLANVQEDEEGIQRSNK